MGDFNYNKIDWNQWTSGNDREEAFLECIRDSYLIQHVNTITRSRENSEPSMLDLILTNEEEMIDNLHVKNALGFNSSAILSNIT